MFCEWYVRTFRNGAKAARIAGYGEKSARVEASKMLTNPNIRAQISDYVIKLHDEIMPKPEDIIQRLAIQSQFDPRNFFDNEGKLKDITEMDSAEAFMIQEIEMTEVDEGRKFTKIKYGKDHQGTIDKLMKFYEMYKEAVDSKEIHIHIDSKDAKA